MRKRVTFVDHLKNESLLGDGGRHVSMRSAEGTKRCTDGFERRPGHHQQDMCRGARMKVPTAGQHTKTIQAPKSMMSAPFLQHPALSAGQRHYLYTIANIYSTENMRRQTKQHYLNVLRSCLQAEQNDTCRRRFGDHQHRENATFPKHADKDAARANKPQRPRKNCTRAHSDITLPKIVNR